MPLISRWVLQCHRRHLLGLSPIPKKTTHDMEYISACHAANNANRGIRHGWLFTEGSYPLGLGGGTWNAQLLLPAQTAYWTMSVVTTQSWPVFIATVP